MATNDDTQAFLEVMANMKRLSASEAAENITSELFTLRKRDQENCDIINRFTEDRVKLVQYSKAAADEKRALHEKAGMLEKEIGRIERDLAATDKLAKEREQKLSEETGKVMHLQQYRVNLQTESSHNIGKRWTELWTRVNQLATDFFSENLDADTLREAHGWEPYTSHQSSKGFPSLATNSREAKQMRIVAVDSIIALALTQHIFRPVGMDNAFATAMTTLAHTNPDMEAFYRSSHLIVIDQLSGYTRSVVDQARKTAIKEIINSVTQILPAEKIRDFRIHLEDVCRVAEGEWQTFQRYTERYELDMAGDVHCYDPVPLWQPASTESPKGNGAAKIPAKGQACNGQKVERPLPSEGKGKSAVLVTSVWPLLRAVGTAGAVTTFSGWALFSDQTKEADEQVMRAKRQTSREEGKQEEKKSGSRPLSLGAFLPGSQKNA